MVLVKGFRVKAKFSHGSKPFEFTMFFRNKPSYKNLREALELKLSQVTDAFPDEKFEVTLKDFEGDTYKEVLVNSETVHFIQSPDYMFDN